MFLHFFQISDGSTGYITTLCAGSDSNVVIGTSNSMTLHFHTDSSVVYRGWHLNWSGKKKLFSSQTKLEKATMAMNL